MKVYSLVLSVAICQNVWLSQPVYISPTYILKHNTENSSIPNFTEYSILNHNIVRFLLKREHFMQNISGYFQSEQNYGRPLLSFLSQAFFHFMLYCLRILLNSLGLKKKEENLSALRFLQSVDEKTKMQVEKMQDSKVPERVRGFAWVGFPGSIGGRFRFIHIFPFALFQL